MISHGFRRAGQSPDFVPQLGRGKHRSPRKGACFMEFASYLAGERWSDHPRCTHPLLASLARLVNDHMTDAGRQRLVELTPEVVGLTSEDPRVDVHVALRAATTALPVVAESRQRTLAVAVLGAEAVLDVLDDRPAGTLGERSRWALEQAPYAADWARSFARETGGGPSVRRFRRHAAPVTVRHAVQGLAQAVVPDRDALLHDLLAAAIADCHAFASARRAAAAATEQPARQAPTDRVDAVGDLTRS